MKWSTHRMEAWRVSAISYLISSPVKRIDPRSVTYAWTMGGMARERRRAAEKLLTWLRQQMGLSLQ